MTSLLATLGGALLGMTIAATLIWSVAGLLALLLRRHSAALRHRLWGLSFAAVLAAPAVAAWLPLPRGVEWMGPDATAVGVAEPVSLAKAVWVKSVTEPLERRGVEFARTANPYHMPVLTDSALLPHTPPDVEFESVVPAERSVSAALPLTAEPATKLWPVVFGGFVVIWCVGLVLGISLSLLSHWRIWRLLRRSLPVEHAPVLDLCRDLAFRLKLRRRTRVLTSAETAVPFVTGIVQPALVLPAGFGAWTADRLQVVLAHELMHVRRGDVAWQWLAQTTLAATWFHPLAWVALWRLRLEREHACDDAVLLAGYQPADYATHLVEVAAELRQQTARFAPAVAMASRSPIERRIRAILDATLPRGPAGRWRTAATMLGLAMGLVVAVILTPRSGSAQAPMNASAPSAETSEKAEVAVEEAKSDTVTAEDNQNPIVAALDRKLTLSIKEMPLNNAFARLARESGIPIQVDLAGLRVAKFDVLSPRTLELRDIALRDAISALIQNGAAMSMPDPNDLTLVGEVDLLLVTTPQEPNTIPSDEASDPLFQGSIAGQVTDATGQPVPRADVRLNSYWRPTYLTADADGRFAIPAASLRGQQYSAFASSPAGDQMIWMPLTGDRSLIKLQLAPAIVRNVQVVANGKPVPSARTAILFQDLDAIISRTDEAGVASFKIPEGRPMESVCAWSAGLGLDYQSARDLGANSPLKESPPSTSSNLVALSLQDPRTVRVKVVDDDGRALTGVGVFPWYVEKQGDSDSLNIGVLMDQAQQVSNTDGEVSFDWLPGWSKHPVTFWAHGPGLVQQRIVVDLSKSVPDPVMARVQKLVEVGGVVAEKNGDPAAFANVFARGDGYCDAPGSAEGMTDEHGRFRLKLPPNQLYLIGVASKDRQLAGSHDGLLVRSGQPQFDVNITLAPTTRVFGRLTIGPEKAPRPKIDFSIYQYGRDLLNLEGASLPNPANRRDWVQPLHFHSLTTDDDGRFEIRLGPGQYDIRSPDQSKVQKFSIKGESELEFNFHADRPERGQLTGRIVSGFPPSGVPFARITSIARSSGGDNTVESIADKDGNFEFERALHPTTLFARSADAPVTLAGILEIGADDKTVVMAIAPVATGRFKLLEGTAAASTDRVVEFGVRVHMGDKNAPWRDAFGGSAKPDAEGWVTLKQLVVGAKYDVSYWFPDRTSARNITFFTPDKPGPHELGEFQLPVKPAPYKTPTLAERIQKSFQSDKSPAARHESILADARLSNLRGLTLFGRADAPVVEALYQLWFERKTINTLWDNYRAVSIPIDLNAESPAALLAKSLGVSLSPDEPLFLVIQDADGKVLARVTGAVLAGEDGNVLDPEKLRIVLKHHAPPQLDARELLAAGLAQAKAENKRVLVQETATWCGPCWRLTRFLDAHKAVWSQDYVLFKLDHRWEHAADVAEELRKDAAGGIPWMAILDSDGKTLATSNTEEGDNIGFPSASEPAGIDHFLKMLSTTKQRMTDEDLGRLRKALEE